MAKFAPLDQRGVYSDPREGGRPRAEHSMNKVAFLSFDWDYEIISEYYLGMQDYLQEHDDLQVIIFSAFGHYYASLDPQEENYEVFSLFNPLDYDALIIQGNRSWPPELRQVFVDRMVALGKPAVSINYDLAGATTVGTDNYQAMRGLVGKVITERGCTHTAFVNGLATSVEAQARARAYRDVCAELGVEDARFIQADWEIEAGIETAQKLLAEGGELPEVFFCCNDDLAVGLMETLQEAGVRVPEDVMVSGFDNRELSLRTAPRVTTIDRDYASIGRTALDTVQALLRGETLPGHVASPVEYILTRSCGYEGASDEGALGDLYTLDNSLKRFYELMNEFQTLVLSQDTLPDVFAKLERFAPEVRCPNVYISLNERFLHREQPDEALSYGAVSYLMAHSGDAILAASDKQHIYASYLTERLLPPSIPLKHPIYVVYPLRHNATCLGIVVTQGVSPLIRHGFLTFFISLLAGSFESVRRSEMLHEANRRLDHLYVHDELSGLYNRFGLERFGRIAYDRLLREDGEAYFVFVDIDDMKSINDEHGHKMGDNAIADSADVIRRATVGEDAFCMRYGGDEFLIICAHDLRSRVMDELQLLAGRTHQPYRLSLSVGACRVSASERLTMEEAIHKADTSMYRKKRARR